MVNFFDIFVVIVTAALAVTGYLHGLLRSVVKLVGFIVTIIGLAMFSEYLIGATKAVPQVPSQIAVPVMFITVFIIASLAFYLLAEVLHKLIKITPIRILDSGLGCLFGVVKALFLTGILAMLISLAPQGTFLNSQYEASHTARTLKTLFGETIPFITSIIPLERKVMPPRENNDYDSQDENRHERQELPPDFI